MRQMHLSISLHTIMIDAAIIIERMTIETVDGLRVLLAFWRGTSLYPTAHELIAAAEICDTNGWKTKAAILRRAARNANP